MFLASDDDGAAAEIGALAEGGLLVEARGESRGQLISKDRSRSTDGAAPV